MMTLMMSWGQSR